MTRRHLAIAAILAGLQSLAFSLGSEGLGDSDPYRHLQYARQLALSGLTLRGHPFLPFTELGTQGVDLWWGFHLALIPFSAFGVLWGARLAGAAIAATSAGGMAWVAARLGQSRPAWFVLIPYLTSGYFAYRAHIARPAYLTPALIFVCLVAGIGKLNARWAGVASFAHGWLHLSAPLSPIFATLGALSAIAVNRSSWRRALTAVAASALGLVASVLLRPDREHFLSAAWAMTHMSLGGLPGGHLPQSGGEGEAPGFVTALELALGPLAALVAALALGWRHARSGSSAARLATLLAVVVSAGLTLEVKKFADYLLPSLALAAALWWPADLDPLALVRRPVAALVLAVLTLRGALIVAGGWATDAALFPPFSALERLGNEVRAKAPAGSMLFVDDWGWAGVLYGVLPEYRYPLAYNPSTLYAASPRRFWIWEHASAEGAYCDQPSLDACPEARSSAGDVAHAMKDFGAEWVVTRGDKGPHDMLHVIEGAPERFELVTRADAAQQHFRVWHLRP